MTPSDPLLVFDPPYTIAVFNCTFEPGQDLRKDPNDPSAGTWSSKDMYFAVFGQLDLRNFTSLLDPMTAQLQMPVTQMYFQIHVNCLLRGAAETEFLAETTLTVGRKCASIYTPVHV
jgi:hypothetical protein